MKKLIIGFFILFTAILAFKMFLGYRFSPVTMGLPGLFKEKSVDYVFIGSSQTRQGLSPMILQDSLHSAYIVAYNGNSLFYINFLIAAMLENKSLQLKKIVVEAYPYRVFQKVALSDVRLFNGLQYQSKMKFLQYSKNVLSPWDNYELVMLSGNENIATYPFLRNFNNSLSYRGGYTEKEVAGISAAAFAAMKPPISDTTVYTGLNALQVESLEHIIALCKEHGVQLYFIEPPAAKNVMQSQIYSKAHADLKKIIVDHHLPYFDITDYLLDNTNPAFFHDEVHLSSLGRDAYTKSIIKLFR